MLQDQILIETSPPVYPTEDTPILETQRLLADNCIKNHVIAAMGAGLIPSALVDIVVITGIEINMIRNLAAAYEFPVPHRLVAYKVLLSLIGSIGPVYFSSKMQVALKGVPLVGYTLSVGLLSITGGTSVYAVGKIFQKHYESGGIFLSSDNHIIRTFFRKKIQEGKQAVPALLTIVRQPV